MGTYSSWINVSNFILTVEADNEEEARKKMQDQLDNLIVRVIDEDEGGYTNLGCEITDITEGVC